MRVVIALCVGAHLTDLPKGSSALLLFRASSPLSSPSPSAPLRRLTRVRSPPSGPPPLPPALTHSVRTRLSRPPRRVPLPHSRVMTNHLFTSPSIPSPPMFHALAPYVPCPRPLCPHHKSPHIPLLPIPLTTMPPGP